MSDEDRDVFESIPSGGRDRGMQGIRPGRGRRQSLARPIHPGLSPEFQADQREHLTGATVIARADPGENGLDATRGIEPPAFAGTSVEQHLAGQSAEVLRRTSARAARRSPAWDAA